MDSTNGKLQATIAPCTRCLAIAKSKGEPYIRHADDLIRLDGMCEMCYRLVVVKPYKDEETRLMESLDILRGNYLTALARIGAAKEALKPLLPKPQPNTNGRYVCRKCGSFASSGPTAMIELITHQEEFCKGKAKNVARPRNSAATARKIVESVDVEDVFNEVE